MSALNSKSRLTAMSTQYSNPMAAKPSKRQVYGRKGRRRLDPLKKKKRSPSPELCSAHRLPNPVQYIFAPEPISGGGDRGAKVEAHGRHSGQGRIWVAGSARGASWFPRDGGAAAPPYRGGGLRAGAGSVTTSRFEICRTTRHDAHRQITM